MCPLWCHHCGDIIVLQTDIEATFQSGNQTPQSVTSFKGTAEVKSHHNSESATNLKIKKKKRKRYLFEDVKFC